MFPEDTFYRIQRTKKKKISLQNIAQYTPLFFSKSATTFVGFISFYPSKAKPPVCGHVTDSTTFIYLYDSPVSIYTGLQKFTICCHRLKYIRSSCAGSFSLNDTQAYGRRSGPGCIASFAYSVYFIVYFLTGCCSFSRQRVNCSFPHCNFFSFHFMSCPRYFIIGLFTHFLYMYDSFLFLLPTVLLASDSWIIYTL